MKILVKLMVLCYLSIVIQGCSTVQATSGPKYRDLSVVEVGADRYSVLAELGQPVATEADADGTKIDVFSFRQGQSPAVKGSKAFLYGLAAVGTLGMSELITSPLEGSIGSKGAEIQLKVGYDANDLIDYVQILRDNRWFPIQELRDQEAQPIQ